jgi:Zn finger protein HypA/HybF involved in hydrogenase expression
MGRRKKRTDDLFGFGERESPSGIEAEEWFVLVCPSCGGRYYRVADEVRREVAAGRDLCGEDLEFLEEYGPNGYNWGNDFSDHDTSWALCCPNCGSPYGESMETMEVVRI